MTKKEALVRDLALLLAKHSPSDWLHAAQHLEEVARIARGLSKKKEIKKTPARRPRPPNKVLARDESSNFSEVVEDFALYLLRNTGGRSQPNLKDGAIQLGMKSDLPSSKSASTALICEHLQNMDEKSRDDKIKHLFNFISSQTATGVDAYDRWFSLITKRP